MTAALAPRWLPATIGVLGALLAIKAANLGRAAFSDAPREMRAASWLASPASASTPPAAAPAAASAPPRAAPETPAEPQIDAAERAVLLELRQRRQELEAREATIGSRESLLTAAERKLGERVAEMQGLQRKLEALESGRRQREDAGWQGLVKLYEGMKPREAATILNDLALPVLTQVMDRMKDAKASAILAAMHPDKARDVTQELARLRTQPQPPKG